MFPLPLVLLVLHLLALGGYLLRVVVELEFQFELQKEVVFLLEEGLEFLLEKKEFLLELQYRLKEEFYLELVLLLSLLLPGLETRRRVASRVMMEVQ